MLRYASAIACIVLICGPGCGLLCDAPEQSTYSCNPLPAGSPGCVGGPLGDAPAQIFPANCSAEIPSCDSDGGVRSFSCYQAGPSTFTWFEYL